jgi:serine/threonine protein kinase
MALITGTRFGSYEILSVLGVGGMGEVYRARDMQLNRDVAIKVLLNLSTDAQRLHRFEQEAQATAALNHPNILAIYHMGRYENAPYIVSELLEGETLRTLLKRNPLPVRKAVEYGIQFAHGLEAAHERGIVHRDLKPENLFITKDGRLKILDFGLAKLTQPLQSSEFGPGTLISGGTEPGVVMGTVGYMSPEQVRGESSDHRTDIFAFGVVLYEMLTGKRAFQKPTATETMTAILNEDPINVVDLVPNLPLGLQRIVHRCLEKGLEQRFQSAADLAFALETTVESSLSGQRPIIVPPPPETKTKNWLVPALAVLLILGLAGGVFLEWPKIRAHLAATQTPAEANSTLTPAPSKDAKAVGTASAIPTPPTPVVPAAPHQLTIPDTSAYNWFDSTSKQALVWYSTSADGSFRYFDGPGNDPQTGQTLTPVTPDFVASLHPPKPVPVAPSPKQKVASSTIAPKAKDKPVSDSATDSLQQDAQREALAQDAQNSLTSRNYRAALDTCAKVLGAAPGSQPCTAIRQHASIKLAEQYVNEASNYWEQGQFDQALKNADQALELDPANQKAAKLRQLALHMQTKPPK